MTAAGTIRVSFDRDVSQCAIVGTPAANGATLAPSVASANHQEVIVASFDGSGHISPFSIAGFC
jgi:hypothetical protein